MIKASVIPSLEHNAVHVWTMPLDYPLEEVSLLQEILSSSERERADCFVKEIDRHRFIVSHAALREILGHYLNLKPDVVELTIRPGGKPELAHCHSSQLQFNLSHSYRMGMVAIALESEVGVDIEQVRSNFDIASIVKRFFSQGETTKWQRLAEGEKKDAFFRCWTRKEAYLKARGIGLSLELDQFEVSFALDEPAGLLSSQAEPVDSSARWIIHDVSPNDEFIAACVVERAVNRVFKFDWTADEDDLK